MYCYSRIGELILPHQDKKMKKIWSHGLMKSRQKKGRDSPVSWDWGWRENCSHYLLYIRDHPFKTSANFSRFLTPTPLPSAVLYYYLSANLVNFWPLPPKTCRRLKWMVPYLISKRYAYLVKAKNFQVTYRLNWQEYW